MLRAGLLGATLCVAGACGKRAPAEVLPASQRVVPFSLEGHGQRIVGTGVVVPDGDGGVILEALGPGGIGLFSVSARGEAITIEAARPELATLLDRVPFERDLAGTVVYRCGAKRCAAGPWTLVVEDDGWRVRGPGGPARVRLEDDRLVLRDAVRGYTLTLVLEEETTP